MFFNRNYRRWLSELSAHVHIASGTINERTLGITDGVECYRLEIYDTHGVYKYCCTSNSIRPLKTLFISLGERANNKKKYETPFCPPGTGGRAPGTTSPLAFFGFSSSSWVDRNARA